MSIINNKKFTEASNVCPNCGGDLIGDGYTSVVHCEYANEESYENCEPDAGPIYCTYDPYDEAGHQG